VDYILISEASDAGHTYLIDDNLASIAAKKVSDQLDEGKFWQVFQQVISDSEHYFTDNDGRIALTGFKFQEEQIEKFFSPNS